MLRKMMLQGLAAAVLIGGAAAVYAQAQGNGYLPGPAATKGEDKATPGDRHDGGRKAAGHDGGKTHGQDRPGDDD
jgi:hypothetical protein